LFSTLCRTQKILVSDVGHVFKLQNEKYSCLRLGRRTKRYDIRSHPSESLFHRLSFPWTPDLPVIVLISGCQGAQPTGFHMYVGCATPPRSCSGRSSSVVNRPCAIQSALYRSRAKIILRGDNFVLKIILREDHFISPPVKIVLSFVDPNYPRTTYL